MHMNIDLMGVTFPSHTNNNNPLIQSLSHILLRGNQEALVYITAEDLYGFEERKDIKNLHQELLETSDTEERQKITSNIKVLLDRLINLYLAKRRQD